MSIPPVFTFNNGTYGCLVPSNLTKDFTICNGGVNPAVFSSSQSYGTNTGSNKDFTLTNPSQSGMPKTMYCTGAGINTTSSGNPEYILCSTKPININVQSYAQVDNDNQNNNGNSIMIIILIILIITIIAIAASRKNIFL